MAAAGGRTAVSTRMAAAWPLTELVGVRRSSSNSRVDGKSGWLASGQARGVRCRMR